MDTAFSLGDLHHFLAIKLCWPIFLAGAVLIWYKWPERYSLFLLWTGIMCGLGYYLLVDDLGLMFWGLKGDEITIAAMFEAFAHGGFMQDFGYANLPPFYPPLYFWIFALVGKFANWNGIQIAKFASLVSITVFPILAYSFQKLFFTIQHKKNSELQLTLPGAVAMMLAPLIAWLFTDWDAMILKPYELISAFVTFIWMGSLIPTVLVGKLTWKWGIVYAVTGGCLFMAYYLWLVFAYIGAAVFALTIPKKDVIRFYVQIGGIGFGILLFSLPYLAPLIHAYQLHGSENWQVALITARGIALDLPMFQGISWRSLFMLSGLVSLIWYAWRNIYVRALASFFVAAYVWYIMGLVTALFFDAPIQEFKGFHFFSNTILALALAYGMEQGWKYIKLRSVKLNFLLPTIAGIGLLFLSAHLIFGFFADDPVVQKQRIAARGSRKTVVELVEFLKTDEKQKQQITTFHAGIAELHAYLPMNAFVYFNQHNSHPAAQFTARKAYVTYLTKAKNPKEFYDLSTTTWFDQSIDRYVLFKHGDSPAYRVYFLIDAYPHGGRDEVFHIDKALIQEPYFSKVYENNEFVVFDRQTFQP